MRATTWERQGRNGIQDAPAQVLESLSEVATAVSVGRVTNLAIEVLEAAGSLREISYALDSNLFGARTDMEAGEPAPRPDWPHGALPALEAMLREMRERLQVTSDRLCKMVDLTSP